MPDIQIPAKELIYEKTPQEIGKLLSRITNATEAAKQLKLLYSTAEMADILNTGYMTVNRAADILTDAGFTVAAAASVMDDCGAGRNAAILTDMSVSEAAAQLNHTNFTTSEITKALNHEGGNPDKLRLRWRDAATTRNFKIWITNGVGDLNTPRSQQGAGGESGIYMVFGGLSGNNTVLDTCEDFVPTNSFNSWAGSYCSTLNTPVYDNGSCGTWMTLLSSGGSTSYSTPSSNMTVETEKGFGTWSMEGDLNNAVWKHQCAGNSEAAISFGGITSTEEPTRHTEKYNGTAWATDNDLSTEIYNSAGCGTSAAGLTGGGRLILAPTNITQEYNGTTWSTSNVMNNQVQRHGMFGTQTDGISFGGVCGFGAALTGQTETYDGASWSTSGTGDLNVQRDYHNGSGNSVGGVACGGFDSSGLTGDAEEWQ